MCLLGRCRGRGAARVGRGLGVASCAKCVVRRSRRQRGSVVVGEERISIYCIIHTPDLLARWSDVLWTRCLGQDRSAWRLPAGGGASAAPCRGVRATLRMEINSSDCILNYYVYGPARGFCDHLAATFPPSALLTCGDPLPWSRRLADPNQQVSPGDILPGTYRPSSIFAGHGLVELWNPIRRCAGRPVRVRGRGSTVELADEPLS